MGVKVALLRLRRAVEFVGSFGGAGDNLRNWKRRSEGMEGNKQGRRTRKGENERGFTVRCLLMAFLPFRTGSWPKPRHGRPVAPIQSIQWSLNECTRSWPMHRLPSFNPLSVLPQRDDTAAAAAAGAGAGAHCHPLETTPLAHHSHTVITREQKIIFITSE